MSPEEAASRLREAVAAVEREAPTVALVMAQTGLTLLKEREINNGIQVDGNYVQYSQKQHYKSSYKKKALNQGGRAYASSGGKGTWEGFRQAQGRKGGNVNLFYTGRMWTALRIIAQEQTGLIFAAIVGITDTEAALVFAGNIERFGEFDQLTDNEAYHVNRQGEEELEAIQRRYLYD